MADAKITDLTADTSPTTDDLLVSVNDPSGTPANRKVTIANLIALISPAWTTITPTQTGWSSTTILTGRYTQIGKLVVYTFQVSGTSNATSATITLPVNAANTANILFEGVNGRSVDNGAALTAATRFSIDPSSDATKASLFSNMASGNWTASGTKTVRGTVTYESI